MRAGQAIYTKWTLAGYDFAVLGVVNRTVWGCGTQTLLRNYQDNVGAEHVEIGVGTGYFLDCCRFPVDRPRIVLVDLNQDALSHTMRRLAPNWSAISPTTCWPSTAASPCSARTPER